MAVIEGGTSAALLGVGSQDNSPGHITNYPVLPGAGGLYKIGGVSTVMAVSLAANSEIFQFRYVTAASRLAIIHSVSINAGANVAATAAALIEFRLTVARAWTVVGSGGTRLSVAGNNSKMRTALATSEVNDVGIATTAALNAGTKTLDTSNLYSISQGIGTGPITAATPLIIIPETYMLDSNIQGFAPLILANQEGFVIRSGANNFPTGMTWNFSVNVAWSEVPNY